MSSESMALKTIAVLAEDGAVSVDIGEEEI